MAKEVVKVEDVWVYYDGTAVLEGINLSVKKGVTFTIHKCAGLLETYLLPAFLQLLEACFELAIVLHLDRQTLPLLASNALRLRRFKPPIILPAQKI
jgi:ABC-type transporter Mla maintaining outer membrane lipid asymmetry ATPase subunit MlaF